MKVKEFALAVGLVMLEMIVPSVQAVPVNFQGGVVMARPCTINNGELIEVDFGDNLVIRNIDGVRYNQSIPYKIDCSETTKVRLRLLGTSSEFDSASLKTSQPGLAIRLKIGGVLFPWENNASTLIDNMQSPLPLTAVPVVNFAALPSPGPFTAGATLLAEYQ